MCRLVTVVCLVLLVCAPSALAWNATGHMTVALIAWRQLGVAQQEQLADILQAHPHYKLMLLERKPEIVSAGEWAFVRASVWPDMVRPARPGMDIYRGPEITRFNKAYWHYIDFPFNVPGFEAKESSSKPSENILTAMEQNLKKLSAADAKTEERAIALAWVEHLVGDVHQPLHAASMFSANYPTGDRGGNEQTVRAASGPMRLHAYWDDVMGTADNYGAVDFLASRLLAEPLSETAKAQVSKTDPKVWAQESHDLAVAVAYLNGTLKTSKSSEYDSKKVSAEQVPALPPGYEATAREVAEQRMVVAGFRLAEKLKGAMKE